MLVALHVRGAWGLAGGACWVAFGLQVRIAAALLLHLLHHARYTCCTMPASSTPRVAALPADTVAFVPPAALRVLRTEHQL